MRKSKFISMLLSVALLVNSFVLPVGATGVNSENVSGNTIATVSENAVPEETATEGVVEEAVEEKIISFYVPTIVSKDGNTTVGKELRTITVSGDETDHVLENSAFAVHNTKASAAKYLRGELVKRSSSISVTVPVDLIIENENFFTEVFDEAIAHTEDCSGQEGDALKFAFSGSFSARGESSGSNFTLIYSNIPYHSTAAQEEALSQKVKGVMAELALDGKTEYEKIHTIYKYICDNVNYDHTETKYSAYEALCNGEAVCQGYAVLFYRLCKEAGLSVRIISGRTNTGSHAWNIVKLGDYYYNVDSTWDGQDVETKSNWFLLNDIDFVDHFCDPEYVTEEFRNAYPMAEYSYGKETVTLPNKTNPAKTFTTIDETTISSTANGKPKVLIFFRSTCSICKNSIKAISNYGLQGVDIYAIESMFATKESVIDFKNNYGSDEVEFSYSLESDKVNNSAMHAYLKSFFENYSNFSFPVICYIDANNNLQHLTLGKSDGAHVSYNLQRYCGYTEQFKEYTITYHLDGGTNHAENPAKYTAKSDIIVLKDACKTGFAFKGWYSDSNYTTKVTQINPSDKKDIVLYAKFVKELELTKPAKTTYVVGEKIDLTGGTITHNASNSTSDLKSTMISGFDSTKEGICTVTVTYKNCKTTFPVLIVKKPELQADYGQTLSQITLPVSEYGTYSWKDADTCLDEVGACLYSVSFTPNDIEQFSVYSDVKITVEVYGTIADANVTAEMKEYVYNGLAYKPEVSVEYGNKVLTSDDYSVSYQNNINAGEATITITGKNYYKDSKNMHFTIKPAKLTIKAKDMTVCRGDSLPTSCEYEVIGLALNETLVKEPQFTFTVDNTENTGIFEIIPANAQASANYDAMITYVNGTLMIAEEKVGYTVTFDVQGHGTAPQNYVGVKAGNIVKAPQIPTAEGYIFDGWYKDAACTKVWDFDNDIVQGNVTLYAKWLEEKADSEFKVSEIPDVSYTGKAIKPVLKVYDGDTLLKANKDYKVTYGRNTDVNTTPASEVFDENLPYVIITGKGNYKESIKINFNIVPAQIGDGSNKPATGVVLKVDEQLVVNASKAVNPFKSLKAGRTMKENADFVLELTAVNVTDATGQRVTGLMPENKIPAGCSGKFVLKITGINSYTGSINKPIYVTAKNELMKNAKITLGKNLKSVDFDKYHDVFKGQLQAGYYDSKTKKYCPVVNGIIDYDTVVDAKDVYIVKNGNQNLVYGKDFTVRYENDERVGTVTMVLSGIGKYYGEKSITFKLTGKPFSTKTIVIGTIASKPYTGYPITQNDVALTTVNGDVLEYGKDYIITYAKNINKGKATMTFTTVGDSGYQGSIKKTFTIETVSMEDVILDVSMENITAEYDKAGVKPADKVVLYNKSGKPLVNGKDYTLNYKNTNKAATAGDEKAPLIVIKGKGNYTNTIEVPFTIEKAYLEKMYYDVKPIAYNSKKDGNYAYKPAIKILDGKKALTKGKDYEIKYVCNTQADFEAWYENGAKMEDEGMPRAVITAVENGNYEAYYEEITIPLPIYKTKLAASNLHVVVDSAYYTGAQVTPNVTVYYSEDTGKVKAAKELKDEAAILALGLRKLESGTDYTIHSYGTNIVAGKNKGSVKIEGTCPEFGGNVTIKFTIGSKDMSW